MTHTETLKTTLKESLQESVLKVTFTKKDGTERELICTLKSDLLPKAEEKEESNKKTKKENPNVLSAYDLENKGWRSFRLDSVKSAVKQDH